MKYSTKIKSIFKKYSNSKSFHYKIDPSIQEQTMEIKDKYFRK